MGLSRKGFILSAITGAGVVGAAVATAGLTLPQANAQSSPPALIQASTNPSFPGPPGGPVSFADIFQRVSPAVVSINVTSRVTPAEMGQMQGIPFPFNQLPQFQNPGAGQAAPGGRSGRGAPAVPGPKGGTDGEDSDAPEAQAAGSGFFIAPTGYVVTNNHVVENATKITVVLPDGRELPARVIGRDEATDLAVIKVEGSDFPYVNFETQAKPRVGDWVLAVGNPLQLGGTATAGIVSYVGRELQDRSSTFVDYLQIDAPINRGNSGGPTFDTYGRVIGVNTAIYSQTGGSIGIGFAIPAAQADTVIKQLMTGKTIQRGYLGAKIEGVSSEIAESLGIANHTGAIISDLVPGGPGDHAGLKPGDLVLSINGEKVRSSASLTRAVAQTHAGDTFTLGVRRQGRDLMVPVKAGTRPSETQLNSDIDGSGQPGAEGQGPGGRPEVVRQTVLGLTLTPLTDAMRRGAGVEAGVHGVFIEGVQPNSDAARKGLRHGDVIVQANEGDVSTPADVAAAVAAARKAGRPSVFMLVNRGGQNIGLPIKLGAEAK